jgi:hypothetical protein
MPRIIPKWVAGIKHAEYRDQSGMGQKQCLSEFKRQRRASAIWSSEALNTLKGKEEIALAFSIDFLMRTDVD